MASRSRTSFQKRQKELARQEKQRDKAAKRQQRKLDRQAAAAGGVIAGTETDDSPESLVPSAGPQDENLDRPE
jgi:hypothetical protein